MFDLLLLLSEIATGALAGLHFLLPEEKYQAFEGRAYRYVSRPLHQTAFLTGSVLFLSIFLLFLGRALHQDITVGGHAMAQAVLINFLLLVGAILSIAVLSGVSWGLGQVGSKLGPIIPEMLTWTLAGIILGVPPLFALRVSPLLLQALTVGFAAGTLILALVIAASWYLIKLLRREQPQFFARAALGLFIITKVVQLVVHLAS